ncbi:hypothetical protein Btru_048281 [Bulinus truncatus]|nr:hypothetical protein Btru_048281 [Bulinus truncatus]
MLIWDLCYRQKNLPRYFIKYVYTSIMPVVFNIIETAVHIIRPPYIPFTSKETTPTSCKESIIPIISNAFRGIFTSTGKVEKDSCAQLHQPARQRKVRVPSYICRQGRERFVRPVTSAGKVEKGSCAQLHHPARQRKVRVPGYISRQGRERFVCLVTSAGKVEKGSCARLHQPASRQGRDRFVCLVTSAGKVEKGSCARLHQRPRKRKVRAPSYISRQGRERFVCPITSSGKEEKGNDTRMNTIFLVGRSGNGLSSCIQSIDRTTLKGKNVNAVKCPGVGDRGDDRTVDIQTAVNNIEKLIKYHSMVKAIVHVIKYGVRFTKQEKDAADDIKSIFGQNAYSTFGVILMTYGDQFKNDAETDGRSFERWCSQQTGDIRTLFQEVNNRVVLFDNMTRDNGQLTSQLALLNRYVSEIDGHYTFEHFVSAASGRRILISREERRRPMPDNPNPQVPDYAENQHLLGRRVTRTDKVIIALVVTMLIIIIIILGVTL